MIPADLLYRLANVALFLIGIAGFGVVIKLTIGDNNSGR